MENKFSMQVDATLVNEAFIRSTVANFALPLRPTVSEINDIKTAVSEAITNSIVHGYNGNGGTIFISCFIEGEKLTIEIKDNGVGIKDISKAREPFYTTKKDEERSGMGFTLMETFMDSLDVKHNDGGGLIVVMTKVIAN